MTEFRIVTKKDLIPLFGLSLKNEQWNFVARPATTLAQAAYEDGAEVFGMWGGDTPVGMIATIDFADPGASLDPGDPDDVIYVWRLLIDEAHQRRGYGRMALDFAAEKARALGRRGVLLTSVDSPGSAIPFYEAYGFKKTGRIIDDEVELSLDL